MRLRNKPWAPTYLKNDEIYFFDIEKNKGKSLNSISDKKIFLEIGSGKGDFITNYAIENPNIQFIALDRFPTIMATFLKKIRDTKLNLKNLKLVCEDAKNLLNLFDKDSTDRIFINFPDPWPKNRHEKRRIVCREFLSIYHSILKKGGIIEFKSDQKDLYLFLKRELKTMKSSYKIVKKKRNLHFLNKVKYQTEYEKKFVSERKKISYIKMIKL